ncbi:MAG: hypothetical protein NXI04_13515 [Planctomycetaceae bacterium]|nr:hypothetical protein [Planctomycetaceae bacterium]
MNRFVYFAVTAFVCSGTIGVAKADGFVAPVLGESWCLFAETPKLAVFQGQLRESGYHYQAASANGFNISAFVEQPAVPSNTHVDCFEHYWPKMKRNPLIDAGSVEIKKGDDFVKVTYDLMGVPAKAPRHNVNYYVAHNGRWIDIHISMVPDLPRAETIAKFEKSLQFRSFNSLTQERTGKAASPR